MTLKPSSILVLYDAKGRTIEAMARAVCEGVEDSGLAVPTPKTIDEASRDHLLEADGLILGSPNWSGISGTFKQWLDDQGDLWEERVLAGRPGAAFTTGDGTTLRNRNHAPATDTLDAGLRYGHCRTALV